MQDKQKLSSFFNSKRVTTISLALLTLAVTAVAYTISFQDFEVCLKNQQMKFDCDQFSDFKQKLECKRYLTQIKTSIKLDEAFQRGIDAFESKFYKLKQTINFSRRIRNLPYGFEENFLKILEFAQDNEEFFTKIFKPTYLYCLKYK
ncbi:hypothetical protein ABPG74_012386 [Tetrahymena malaccensis]